MTSEDQELPASATPEHHSSPQVLKKRRKRNGERARVTRACDKCKRRKIKCNGTQPCEFCTRTRSVCTFNASYSRGRAPIIPRTPNGIVNNQRPDTNGPLASPGLQQSPVSTIVPDATRPTVTAPSHVLLPDYGASPTPIYSAAASSRASPEPSQTDLQGHYIGPASGVSFLLRVQKRLHQAISFSQASTIFTFGDAPLQLPEFDPSFCMMLPKNDAQRLVDRYFDFAMPTYRFLHRPTIQDWFEEFYDTFGVMRDSTNAPAKVALLFMVFALARLYMPSDDLPGPSDLSTRYFLAAEHQLSKERGSIQLTSVQARLTQCYYLLAQSRINNCWSLFGTVSHLALAIGLNRNRSPDTRGGLGVVESECRRRTFWCAYTLDAYLSIALGRPRSFHDDDIDTEFPACIDDHELTADYTTRTSTLQKTPSTMLAPIAHIKLARIIGKIVRDLYSIKPISASRRAVLTERIAKNLSDWRVELSRFLDADLFSLSLLVPIFQRQRNVLNLTYWHVIILTYRPFVLSNFARLSRQTAGKTSEDAQTEEGLRQCLLAAMNTVRTMEDITETQQTFRAFWITAYFAFSATIMLYIYIIQKRASPPDVYSTYFAAATRCQTHISSIAQKGSLPERYCLVLDELRRETLRQVRRMHPSATSLGLETEDLSPQGSGYQTTSSLGIDGNASDVANYADLLGETVIDFNGMPSSAFSDPSGWGQFISMVSSGLGNMDLFLNDDSFP